MAMCQAACDLVVLVVVMINSKKTEYTIYEKLQKALNSQLKCAILYVGKKIHTQEENFAACYASSGEIC